LDNQLSQEWGRNNCFLWARLLSEAKINAILTVYPQIPHFLKKEFGFFQLSASMQKILLCLGDVSNL
jgi:hypothetical protein